MLYSIKRFWLVLPLLLLVASGRSVFGFSMLGPYENWQVVTIGYQLADDDGGPKDLGDGYRYNTRTLYYACDASYSDFFGANGVAAIDQAFFVFNSLTNLSSYSTNLSEWPLNTSRINGTANALTLLDIKSMCMSKIVNMLGLAMPDRYVWDIHDRFLPPGGVCPFDENYVVVQRNFDPVSFQYSSFVNGTLYDYTIVETCTVGPVLAQSVPFTVDPTDATFTPVASGIDGDSGHQQVFPGRYFTGLTRDDIGGLRYLYSTNRMNVETVASNVFQLVTNQQPQLIITSNLTLFYAQALTNTTAAFQAIYPDLIITSTNEVFTNVVTTNITAQLVVGRGTLAGTIDVVLVTNFTTNAQPIFFYTFANLVIYTNFPNSIVETVTSQIGALPGAPAGTLTTNNVTNTTIVTGMTNGAFYIIPTNLCGGFANIRPQLTNVIAVTNPIAITNLFTFASTNTNVISTNFLSANIITFFTNYILVANAVPCGTNTTALREGLDKINFQNVPFDSILGTAWGPVTNVFQLTAVISNAPVVQTFRRVVTQPDILIEAKDGINGPANPAQVLSMLPALLNFNSTAESSDGNGPGTIEPQLAFVFTKGGGPIFFNFGGFFVQSQATAINTPGGVYWQWGSFDGSTNAPIVYPDGTSLAGLESLVFFQILTTSQLTYSASGNSASNPFTAQLQAAGGTPPYTWSLAPGSAGLPPGLTLSSSGVISGVSTASGGTVFDFSVQATDSSTPTPRVTQAATFITIAQ